MSIKKLQFSSRGVCARMAALALLLCTTSLFGQAPDPEKWAQFHEQAALQSATVFLAPIVYHPDLVNTPFTHGDGIPGTTDSSNIGNPDTWEYYRFCAQQDDVVTIETHRTTFAMDPTQQICIGTAIDTTGILAFVSCGPDMVFLTTDDDNNGIPHGVGGDWADPRSQFVAPVTGEYTLAVFDFLPAGAPPEYEIHVDGISPCAFFDKEIVSGNDVDGADGIDMAVEVGIEDPSMYDFKINYNQPDWPPVIIEDSVPAEWRVTDILDDTLNCDFAQANKGKKDDKSATKIVCEPEGTEGMATIWAEARCHGNRNNAKCRPTSCGALYLNNGAAAYEIDPETGEPAVDEEGNRLPPLGTTNALCLVAVEDLDGGGIDYTGMGDEDGDGLDDLGEACEIGTDPCLEDTDGDGVNDFDEVASGCMDPLNPDTDGDTINDGDELNNGTDPCDEDTDGDGVRDDVDACPLEGPPDPSLGEILQPDGCIRQSQCSDGIDNEPDGKTDFPDDASCDDILDDSEDTVDPTQATCADIETSDDMWGRAASGVDLRAWTSSTLHYIGCPTDGCNPDHFYCTDGAGSLQFGTTSGSTLRSAVDPGDGRGDDMPTAGDWAGCCDVPLGLCNAPNSVNNGVGVDMVTALCNALGYANGTILREVLNSNFCPESHAVTADGQDWDSDFVDSQGWGAEYLCFD